MIRRNLRPPLCLAGFAVLLALSGCGASKILSTLDPGFPPKGGAAIQLGEIRDSSTRHADMDLETMLSSALNRAIAEKGILWTGSSSAGRVVMDVEIIDYARGNAFKRWLLPGWGSTVLEVRCELRQDGDAAGAASDVSTGLSGPAVVGSVEARRTVSMGGGYSIGAWRGIFDTVADDIAKELGEKLGK